jgi:hypothetical protein
MSSPVLKGILGGALAVVTFDAVASLASQSMGWNYSRAAPISFVIYATIGFIVARSTTLGFAILAGSAVGAVDASIGWWVSVVIGPGRPTSVQITPVLWFVTFCIVAVMAAGFAFVGGLIARLLRRKTA